ncbi:hypothetical protein TRIP_D250065 [uncultured Paludibacter sp.]|nr:hypothetical protein TRIP_D250065 [uncultured Paludibacter sp.]
MVDVAALGGKTSAGVYIPNQANFVDRAIYEDDMKLLLEKGSDGIIYGVAIEGVVTKQVPKVNGMVIITQFLFNMYKGIFDQTKANTQHNKEVKKLKDQDK